MKRFGLIIFSLSLLLVIFCLSSCSKVKDEVLEQNFVIDTETREVNFGEDVYLEPFSAKDKDGKWQDAIITVADANGKNYEIKNFSFTPDKLGEYVVTYTINFGKNNKGTLTKSYIVLVKDLSAPTVAGFTKDNLVVCGDEVDLSSIVIEDNVDTNIVPTIKVTFDNEEVDIVDNKVTLSEEGCYVVNIMAKDSAGNEANEKIYLYTSLNYEEGYVQENEWYLTEITDKKSFNGDYAAQVHWFDNNICWLNDGGVFGSKTTLLSEDAKYLSFWVYFDSEASGLDQLVIHNKYTYYDTKIYDKYGNELEKYYQYYVTDPESDLYKYYGDGKWVYEMHVDNWYRMVINLTECNNVCLHSTPITDSTLKGNPNPKTLTDLIFGLGLWDLATNGIPTIAIDAYIDDLKLTNNPENEVYRTEYQINGMPEEKIMTIGETLQLELTVVPENNNGIIYSSTNPAVATVSETGLVTCIAEGQTDIIATCVDDDSIFVKMTVSIFGAETKMPDELNIVKVTGGKSYQNTMNMVEHQFWADNEYENGVCGCCEVFNMSIGHGTYLNYSPLVADGDILKSTSTTVNPSNGYPTVIIGGWQAQMSVEDGLVFSFTAKKDMYIKVKPCDEGLGGWVSETQWSYVKFDTNGNYEVLQTLTGPNKDTIITEEWIEINEGETFVLAINAVYDWRNIELLPWFEIAPAIISE